MMTQYVILTVVTAVLYMITGVKLVRELMDGESSVLKKCVVVLFWPVCLVLMAVYLVFKYFCVIADKCSEMGRNKDPQPRIVYDKVIEDIMQYCHLSKEDAEKLFSDVRSWCSGNIINNEWSDVDQDASAVTTYGLKHICEKEIGKYVSNNWMKAALYYEGFPVKKDGGSTVTIKDMFDNEVNFYYKS